MRSLKASGLLTATSTPYTAFKADRLLTDSGHFAAQKPAKLSMNSEQQINSAKLFVNHDRLIIKNLNTLEPLSHLVDDEKLIELLEKDAGKDFTALSHLPIVKPNFTSENFEIKRSKLPKKSASSKLLKSVYGTEAFRIRTFEPSNEKKIRKKTIKQFANLRKGQINKAEL